MSAQEIPVNGKTSIDVTLAEASVGLDEVVVTAIGIRREKKALGYAVQDIAGDVVQKAAAPTIVADCRVRVPVFILTVQTAT